MDGESENGNGTAYPLSGFDVTRKAVFFGHFLLGQQKKVPRPQGRNGVALEVQPEEIKCVSPEGELLSLLVQRK